MQVEVQEGTRARFGVFDLELRTGELWRWGRPVHLSPQPLKLLVLLLDHPGQLLTREEIQQQIWGNETFVDFEHGLNFAIKKIRDALGDDAETPRYIETLPRRGYRFIAPVEWVRAAAAQPRSTVAHAADEGAVPKPNADADATTAVRSRFFLLRAKWAWTIAAGCVLAAGIPIGIVAGLRYRLAEALHLRVNQIPPRISSIAVLPLDNLSSDPQQEYFTDGLTDALITNLGQVGTMRVISRESVMQFKHGKTPLPQIARDLNVDAVVEGTVLREGSRIRISVQLLDARADRHLWAHTYEHNLEDVIHVERQAALEIAHEVSGRLTTAEEMRLKSPESVKPEAYDAFLRGTYLLAERRPEAETGARDYFDQAVRSDPNFAPAYGGLAFFYSLAWGITPDFSRAEAYARNAIALDPGLPDGHAALGYIRLQEHRYPEAEKEIQEAIALNPNYSLAYHIYADYWTFVGRPTEALAENGKALELDPFSYANNYMQTGILYFLGKYDAALEKAQIVAALNPEYGAIHEWTAEIYWAAGRAPEALAEERKVASGARSLQMERDVQEVAAVYSHSGLHAALSREATLRAQRRTQILRSGATLADLYSAQRIANLYSFLADRENTLHWLDEMLREEPGHSPEDLMCSRSFDFLRSDSRFTAIERRLGLPVESELPTQPH
jgi:TolB-like protein/DNA-binding winged helix-turn-helix (wHTH) protein/Tfp pilus assembly protein PilF